MPKPVFKEMPQKLVILAVGSPGSGKDFLFEKKLEPLGFVRVSADHFFERDGAYRFDATQLGAAHRECQLAFERALDKGQKVYVSNTNTRHRERKDYLSLAHRHGYEVWLISFPDRGFQNVHNVPPEKVKEMRDRTDLPPGVHFWTKEEGYRTGCSWDWFENWISQVPTTSPSLRTAS
jgi:hypothetical protein